MNLKIYEYKNCSTCQKALKYLEKRNLKFERLPIVEQPPTAQELKTMLEHLKAQGGSFKSLFNSSGVQYRELKISDRIKSGLSENEALELLAKNGKLIKRPFLLTPNSGTVGFNETLWTQILARA